MQAQVLCLILAFAARAHSKTIETPRLLSRRDSSDESLQLGIYHGSKTCIKDHPNLGALLVNNKFFCEVTIISSQWVLTSGDCVDGQEPSELAVVVGSDDGLKGTKLDVKSVVPHPNFGKEEFDYDYALIQTKTKMSWSDKVKPVNLTKTDPKPNTKMVVAGWGSTSPSETDDDPDNTLLQGELKWLADKLCTSYYKPFGITWSDRLACAYNKGKTTLCTGDWGNAFINKGELHGIFIAAPTKGFCSSEAYPVLLANITPVVDWIKKTSTA